MSEKKEVKTFVIKVTSNDEDDIADTLEHIANQIRNGYTSGFDRNQHARYEYDTE